MYLSLRILPEDMRGCLSLAYLLCRAADTIADTDLADERERKSLLECFPEAIKEPSKAAALAAGARPGGCSPGERLLLEKLGVCAREYLKLPPECRALVDEVVDSVCRGMLVDLGTFGSGGGKVKALGGAADLENYCSLIGGGPGVFWTKLSALAARSGPADERRIAEGRSIGEVLQITNILRDFSCDIARGRCYLPADGLAAEGLSPDTVLAPENKEAVMRVIRKWIGRAAEKLDCFESYMRGIPARQWRLRASIIWPVFWSLDNLAAAAVSCPRPGAKVKIGKREIYSVLLETPPLLISSSFFSACFRRRLGRVLSFLSAV